MTIRSSGGLISSSFWGPLHHQRAPKRIIVPLRHQGPNFPFFASGHLAPHSFPVALLRVSNFPIASSKGKGPKIFHCAIKGRQFHSSCHQNENLISHHVIKGSQFIVTSSRGPPLWPLISHYVIKGSPWASWWLFRSGLTFSIFFSNNIILTPKGLRYTYYIMLKKLPPEKYQKFYKRKIFWG